MGLLWSRVGTPSYYTTIDKSFKRLEEGIKALQVRGRCPFIEGCPFILAVAPTAFVDKARSPTDR